MLLEGFLPCSAPKLRGPPEPFGISRQVQRPRSRHDGSYPGGNCCDTGSNLAGPWNHLTAFSLVNSLNVSKDLKVNAGGNGVQVGDTSIFSFVTQTFDRAL